MWSFLPSPLAAVFDGNVQVCTCTREYAAKIVAAMNGVETVGPILRLTNARSRGLRELRPEYSPKNIFLGDQILLRAFDHFEIYNLDGTPARTPGLRADCRPKIITNEDGLRLKVIYFSGNQIIDWSDPRPWATFTEYGSIDDGGEAGALLDAGTSAIALWGKLESSVDRSTTGYEVFVYDLDSRKKGPVLRSGVQPESVYLAPGRNVIVSYRSPERMVQYDRDMNLVRFIANCNAHKAVGMCGGRPILVWANSNQSPITTKKPDGKDLENGLVMTYLDTGEEVGLGSFPWSYSFHLSLPGKDSNFCYVATYSQPPGPGAATVLGTANAILKLDLLRGYMRFDVLAKHKNIDGGDSEKQTQVTVDPEETVLIWNSNGGDVAAPQDSYLLRL